MVKKDSFIHVRVSASEMNAIRKASEFKRKPISVFVREAVEKEVSTARAEFVRDRLNRRSNA